MASPLPEVELLNHKESIQIPDFDVGVLIESFTRLQGDEVNDDLVYACITSTSPLTSLASSRCPSPSFDKTQDHSAHATHLTENDSASLEARMDGVLAQLDTLKRKGETDLEKEGGAGDFMPQGQCSTKRRRKRKEPGGTSGLQASKLPDQHTAEGAQASLKRKNDKNKLQSKKNKKTKKLLNANSHFTIPAAKASIKERHVLKSQPIRTSNNIEESRTTQNAYIARKSNYDTKVTHSLNNLVGPSSAFNFKLEKWDGVTPKPLLDMHGRQFGHLGGQADANTWKKDAASAADLLEAARGQCRFSGEDHHQRPRGPFPILRCRVSHGGGQTQPCNVSHRDTRTNRKIIQQLNRAPAFRRISNFASSVFASWAPKLHQYYSNTAAAIHGKYPDLERAFPHSAFCATTYNMGPSTVCFPHTDMANLAYGWCAIVALGNYDATAGGHLVLWECKLVIEFPPGSLILIPSAIITHSNTPIQSHERRYSFTQYTAGALFRWVDQEFKTQKDYRESKSEAELVVIDLQLGQRWKDGLGLLPLIPMPP